MTLYLLSFNNYYNRIIKKYDTIADYAQHAVFLASFMNVNFNPNDGVNTQQVLNYTVEDTEHAPDYLLAVDDSNQIVSRWYIIEAVRNRRGQYNYTLHRDVIADYYDSIITSPVFIEKAMLSAANPLIFNREQMTYNQIKFGEVPIKDRTNIPWVVGYWAKPTKDTQDVEVNFSMPTDTVYDEEVSSVSQLPYYSISGQTISVIQNDTPRYRLNFFVWISSWTDTFKNYFYCWDSDGNPIASLVNTTAQAKADYLYYVGNAAPRVGFEAKTSAGATDANYYLEKLRSALGIANFDFPITDIFTRSDKYYTMTDYEALNNKIGTTYKVGDKYYKLERSSPATNYSGVDTKSFGMTSNKVSDEFNKISGALRLGGVFDESLGDLAGVPYHVEIAVKRYIYTYKEVGKVERKLNIKKERLSSKAPYDVFCIPYGSICINNKDNVMSEDDCKELVSAIINAGTSETLYDIQLLPYCPLPPGRFSYDADNNLILKSVAANGDDIIGGVAGIFWVENPDFSITVSAPTTDFPLDVPTDPIDMKVASETDVYRLTSPNYNGTFEFSVVKNGGVQSFDIDCSYKPYTPYIKIAPSFGNLYGQDFNDARGLILGGDFSLPQISNEWANYQIQNKNYQVMFDRQIENMDFNNSVQRKMETANMVAGAFTGGITAGMAGSMMGVPGGAIAGGIAGSVFSLAGGLQDRYYNDQLRSEARDYTIDQFGYELGNIQARPANITKVSSFNPNNKVFPIIEYYTATMTEKEALRNKITYNGMTTMVIGTISEYQLPDPSYIKGRLVRYNAIRDSEKEDFHMTTAIANELNQGVFI